MGVRKAQDAPMATAIKKPSGLLPRPWAIPTDMGAMTTAVAALFMMSLSVMVRISTPCDNKVNTACGKPRLKNFALSSAMQSMPVSAAR